MKDPEALKQTQEFAGRIVDWLSKDPATQRNLAQLIIELLQRPDAKAAVFALVQNVLRDPLTRIQAAQLVGDLLQYEAIRKQTVNLGVHASHQVLNDEEVKDHAVHFVTGVLNDSALQKSGGQAIWNALGYSVTPNLRLWRSNPVETEAAEEPPSC